MADMMRTTAGSSSQAEPLPVKPDGRPYEPAGERVLDAGADFINQLWTALCTGANELFVEGRDRAVAEVGGLSDILRRSAHSLEERGDLAVARYAEAAGEQMTAFVDRIDGRSWRELTGEIQDVARRNPIVVIASAVSAGFIAGRFLMSTAAPPPAAHASPHGLPDEAAAVAGASEYGVAGDIDAGIGTESGL